MHLTLSAVLIALGWSALIVFVIGRLWRKTSPSGRVWGLLFNVLFGFGGPVWIAEIPPDVPYWVSAGYWLFMACPFSLVAGYFFGAIVDKR